MKCAEYSRRMGRDGKIASKAVRKRRERERLASINIGGYREYTRTMSQFLIRRTDYYLCGGRLLAKYSACSIALHRLMKISAEFCSFVLQCCCWLGVQHRQNMAG